MFISAFNRIKKPLVSLTAATCCTVFAVAASSAPKPVDFIEQYAFNHSLWEHNTAKGAATPIWINDFAKATGVKYETNGQFSPRPDALPSAREPHLGYPGVKSSWRGGSTFARSSFNNFIHMPYNFVQTEFSPESQVKDMIAAMEYTAKTHPGVPFYIYEHWPEIGDPFPPSATKLQNYYARTKGAYHQWFLEYYDIIAKAQPDTEVFMIPVGPILADMLTDSSLKVSAIAATELYEDSAPHGINNLYFLAALVTFQALYAQPVADSYTPPSSINSLIVNEFPVLNQYVWDRLNHYGSQGVRVWP